MKKSTDQAVFNVVKTVQLFIPIFFIIFFWVIQPLVHFSFIFMQGLELERERERQRDENVHFLREERERERNVNFFKNANFSRSSNRQI